jgi:hypothetical protein
VEVLGAPTVWQYQDKRAAPPAGIGLLKIIDVSHNALGRHLKVLVKGKNGTYPVTSGNEPLTATVLPGNQSDAAAGRCGQSAYAATTARSIRPKPSCAAALTEDDCKPRIARSRSSSVRSVVFSFRDQRHHGVFVEHEETVAAGLCRRRNTRR